MSSDKDCCVPGCSERDGEMHEVLHKFPNPGSGKESERLRFNTWLYAISGNLLGLSNEHIYKYRRVCRAHFEEKYLCRFNRLSNAAVPTLHLPGVVALTKDDLSGRKPLQQIEKLPIASSSEGPATAIATDGTSLSQVHAMMSRMEVLRAGPSRELATAATVQAQEYNFKSRQPWSRQGPVLEWWKN